MFGSHWEGRNFGHLRVCDGHKQWPEKPPGLGHVLILIDG